MNLYIEFLLCIFTFNLIFYSLLCMNLYIEFLLCIFSLIPLLDRDLQTATHRMELADFEVKTTGSDGKFFGARLPFSWIIKEQVDRLIYVAKQDGKQSSH